AENERAADESAEGAIRALTEKLRFAAKLGAERGDESAPELIAVDQHDERDDEDEREVEEDARRGRDEPERVRRDRSGDLGDLRGHLAIQVRHVHREARSLKTLLQRDHLPGGAVPVLRSAHDEVVELTHESGDREREGAGENERDPDVDDGDAERAR